MQWSSKHMQQLYILVFIETMVENRNNLHIALREIADHLAYIPIDAASLLVGICDHPVSHL